MQSLALIIGVSNRGSLLTGMVVEVMFVFGVRRLTRIFGNFVATSYQTLKDLKDCPPFVTPAVSLFLVYAHRAFKLPRFDVVIVAFSALEVVIDLFAQTLASNMCS